jgi:hypothetical protein
MKDKLHNHFKKWNSKTFTRVLVLVLLGLDILNGQFLRLSWIGKDSSRKMVNLLSSQGELSVSELSHDTMTELLGMIDNTFLFFLFIILINNLFFYIFTLRGKNWAHSYLVFYTLTGALFSLVMVVDSFGMGSFWGVFNIISILLYAYLFIGMKIVPFPPTRHEN